MNALINRLREFYSTDINDLSHVLHLLILPLASVQPLLTSWWSSKELRHIALAAIIVISQSPLAGGEIPVGVAPPAVGMAALVMYNYHPFSLEMFSAPEKMVHFYPHHPMRTILCWIVFFTYLDKLFQSRLLHYLLICIFQAICTLLQ
jgi:hypothetical protein